MTISPDTRLMIAHQIVNSCNIGEITKVLKTTRAGATTSLLLSLLEQNQIFLVLEPTNRIIYSTILSDVRRLSGLKNPTIVHVPSNHGCLINAKRLAENELLKELPYLPLPTNCHDCSNYNQCPMTEILRVEHFDGVAITYDKLAALMLSSEMNPEGIGAEILAKIEDNVDALVLDEAHELMYHRVSSVEPYDRLTIFSQINRLSRLENTSGSDYHRLKLLLANYIYITIQDEVQGNFMHLEHILEDRSSPHSWGRLQAVSLTNPRQNIAFVTDKSKFYNGKLSDHDFKKGHAATYEQIMQLMDTGGGGIAVQDIIELCDILSIITADAISLQVQKKVKKQKDWIFDSKVCTVDRNRILMLEEFLNRMQLQCKTFVTSATFGSSDCTQLAASGTNIKNVLFGTKGDPLGTNSKLTIFADAKSYTGVGRYSTHRMMKEIQRRCTDIMETHSPENCFIICRNKHDCYALTEYFEGTNYESAIITYYRAPEVMGVESDRRIGILVGLAHKPKHAFDVMHEFYIDSQILREESMHADVWQALSRVKDPKGKEPSVVYGLGCSEEDLRNVVNWGVNRYLTITEPCCKGQSRIVDVSVEGKSISQPEVVLKKDWPETIIRGKLCENYLYSTPQKVPNISDYLGTFQKIQYKINSKCSLAYAIFGQKLLSSRKKYSNRTFSKDISLTDELLIQHIDGKTELHFYSLQPDNTVNFIMFESGDEYAISRMKLYLDGNDIPYVIEMIGNLLRVWIFTENTPARNVKNLGQDILQKSGCNMDADKTVKVYPKQTKRNPRSKGDLIHMPFGNYSQILVGGKFVEDFDELDFGHLELSNPTKTPLIDMHTNRDSQDKGAVSTG